MNKVAVGTYRSRGYTKALASTAPAAPAVARPHGPIGAGLERFAMANTYSAS